MATDRRNSSRVVCRISAWIVRPGATGMAGRHIVAAEIEQMSETGVRLRAQVPLPEGERVTLYVGRRNFPVAYRRDVEVVWAGKNEEPGSSMGARMLGAGFRRHIGRITEIGAN